MTGQGLIDRVVDDLKHHVMQAGSVAGIADIHAGAFAHGFEAFEDFDAVGIVIIPVGRRFGLCHVGCLYPVCVGFKFASASRRI